jgi:hypothetical protein
MVVAERPAMKPLLTALSSTALLSTIFVATTAKADHLDACGGIYLDASAGISCEVVPLESCSTVCEPVACEKVCAARLTASCSSSCTAMSEATCSTTC